jgi:hypothetical protein
MTITASRLEQLKACRQQVDAFRTIWGDGAAPMTVEAAAEHATTFDWDWAARRFLSPAAFAGYLRAVEAAWAAYVHAEVAANDEYDRAVEAARVGYNRAKVAAQADYHRIEAAAQADYRRAQARAFAECYINQEV